MVAVRAPGGLEVPRRPVGLADRGAREWAAIWAAGAAWLQPERDYHWIEQVVRAYDEMAAYRRQVRKDGAVQHGSQGQPVAHPLIAEIRRLEERIDKNLSELGLSPLAAQRLGLAAAKTASKLDELAERRAKRTEAARAAPVTVAAEVVDEW
jgi:P27 family predicted phage terminase small subunit